MAADQTGSGITVTLDGPTISAGLLSLGVAAPLALGASVIPDTFLPGMATFKRGIDTVAWASVLPLFFYFKTTLARVKSNRTATSMQAESGTLRFWRITIVTAFLLFAFMEIIGFLVGAFTGELVQGLRNAGLLKDGSPDQQLMRIMPIVQQTQTIVILPLLAASGLVVGWLACSFGFRHPITYLLALMPVIFALRVVELIVLIGDPTFDSVTRSAAGAMGFVFGTPFLVAFFAVISFVLRLVFRGMATLVGAAQAQPQNVPG